MLDDSEIIRLVIDGDSDKFALIMDRYSSKLLYYVISLVKDYSLASDVVQDTFIKAYINLRSFKLSLPLSPWLYRIAHNETISLIKRNKKLTTLDDIDENNENYVTKFDADKLIDKNNLNRDVRKCIDDLNIKYREVIILNYFDNLKYNEISDVLRIPLSTVGIRIKRAKLALKLICDKKGVKYDKI